MEPTTTSGSASSSRALVIAAFAAIYVLWGTTFFAIRIAVAQLPPLLAAGVRFFVAGALLFGFMRLRGAAAPNRLQWRNLAAAGGLMFVADYAPLFWGEKYLPSSVASVLAATIPVLTVLMESLVLRQPMRGRTLLAMLLGFGGVAVLVAPGRGVALPLLPCLGILAGSACWALGSVLNRSLQLPASRPVTSGASMLLGGVGLLALSGAFGEWHAVPHVSLRAVLAMLYLIFFGSILAFTAYVYLLGRLPATSVSSYAYVNPIVAVALGYFLAGEPVTPHMLVGAAMVLVSVWVILRK